MATITIVGMGPGPLSLLTKEAEWELLRADKVFFRTASYPAYDWLHGLGKKVVSFDQVYSLPWSSCLDMYNFMATALLKEAAVRENAIYALPGSPSVLEDTTRMLLIRGVEAGVEIKIVQGVSFIEPTLAAVNFDFSKGLQIVLPGLHLRNGNFSARLAMLVCQVGPEQLDDIVQWLLKTYPRDHQVTLIWTAGLPTYETEHKAVALADLGREFGEGKYFASLLVPPVSGDGARYGRLAAPTKCLDRDDQIRDVLRRDVAAPNPADRCGSMLLGASIYSVKKFSRAPNFPIGPLRIFLSDPDNQFRRWVIMPDRPSAAS